MLSHERALIEGVLADVKDKLDQIDSDLQGIETIDGCASNVIVELRKKINARGSFSQEGIYQELDDVINLKSI